MPKQAVAGAWPVSRVAARRTPLLLAGLGLLALLSLLFTLPDAVPRRPSGLPALTDHKFTMPKLGTVPFSSSILNPFRPASHPPPVQKNSTYGGSSWYSNWNWLSPFSSSVTLDENRSLLPPLRERPTIYCYYDTTVQREDATREAESDVLLTWRRAWWAQGFRPIILSAAEAMNNPLYSELQMMDVQPPFKTDLMRWLAWENMGGGLLAHPFVFPMGPREDALLSFLRRGEFPQLTRWEGLDGGLFVGAKNDIAAAITAALHSSDVKTAKDIIGAVPQATFRVDPSHGALAFYDATTLLKKYKPVADRIEANQASGIKSLNQLINSHLHVTWQDSFSSGIAVLKPFPAHTTHMVKPARQLARMLASCGETPMPASCPPNLPKCSPCVASHPMKISTPARYRNTSTLYTIGTVPHPYTLASLGTLRDELTVYWIRRHQARDDWLLAVLQELAGTSVSSSRRIVRFKEAVAGEWATAHAVWLPAEHDALPLSDLDWTFGFAIPRPGATDLHDGRSAPPVPGPERHPHRADDEGEGSDDDDDDDDDTARESRLLAKARALGASKRREDVVLRDAIEAWNLADTEAWRFARAFRARARVERLKWEDEERRYVGGAGSDRDAAPRRPALSWARWGD